MAAPRFLNIITGKIQQVIAAVTSAPNSIVATDTTGRIDISMLPVGVTAEVVNCPAFENLSAGQPVNLFLNAGALNARLANATDSSKPMLGFTLANVTAPASATIYMIGATDTALSGLTIGTDYYLDVTAGTFTATPPATAGNIVQRVGTAVSATSLIFNNTTYIILV